MANVPSTVLILDVETDDVLGPFEREDLPSVLHQFTETAVAILERQFDLDLDEVTESFDNIRNHTFRIIDHPFAIRI